MANPPRPEDLGPAYERQLGKSVRRSTGRHYTPRRLTRPLVRQTLNQLAAALTEADLPRLRVCDPSCGAGAFLIESCRFLASRLRQIAPQLSQRESLQLIARTCLYGVDSDPVAVELTRQSLASLTHGSSTDFSSCVQCHDALHLDWSQAFPTVFDDGGFDAVIGNPPWGQKAIAYSPFERRALQRRFPSSHGQFDLFRPFTEMAVRLIRTNGVLGLVLPDIVLLKNYPATRQFLIDSLTLNRLSWHAEPFTDATIDAVTIVGHRAVPPDGHLVVIERETNGGRIQTRVKQSLLATPPGFEFNLHLNARRRALLSRLETLPKLGDFFDAHEGVHSGNIRGELFTDQRVDDSCCEMYFGRGEISAHRLTWGGRYIRFSALSQKRTPSRYAHVGRLEWYSVPKVLVRRTGDRILAAADEHGRYASNNFFVVFPRVPLPVDLFGLTAILNSRFMTWYFRARVPRQGRAFAELKIRHLLSFPLPPRIHHPDVAARWNELGRQRASGEQQLDLDSAINTLADAAYGISAWDADGEPL